MEIESILVLYLSAVMPSNIFRTLRSATFLAPATIYKHIPTSGNLDSAGRLQLLRPCSFFLRERSTSKYRDGTRQEDWRPKILGSVSILRSRGLAFSYYLFPSCPITGDNAIIRDIFNQSLIRQTESNFGKIATCVLLSETRNCRWAMQRIVHGSTLSKWCDLFGYILWIAEKQVRGEWSGEEISAVERMLSQ